MDRKSFVFYKDWWDATKDLPDGVRLELYDCIMEYAFTGKIEGLKPIVSVAFNFIKPSIDRDTEKYMSTVEASRSNGLKGGRPKKKTQENPNNPQKPTGFNENPENLDNDNDNDINNSLPNAHTQEIFPPPEVFDKPVLDCYNELASNRGWAETVAMNTRMAGNSDFTLDSFYEYLKKFFAKLQNEGETRKSIKDAMSHFARWLELELKKQRDDRAREKTFGGPSKATRPIVQREIGKPENIQPNQEACGDYTKRF